MSHFLSIAKAAAPGAGCKLRERAYGKERSGEFLRDVIALANAETDGPRHIICGMSANEDGRRRLHGISEHDCRANNDCLRLVSEYVEPVQRVRYEAVNINSKRVGVFEIDGCHDQPYMMRMDHSQQLRRGDAWQQMKGAAVKLGRSQLQRMFEKHFGQATNADTVEVGFDGDVIRRDMTLPVTDFSKLPSALASVRIQQMIDMLSNAADTGASSRIGRLSHARLFGADCAYEKKSVPELVVDLKRVKETHRDLDEHYIFETCATRLQLIVLNQGENTLEDASLTLSLPRHAAFMVAEKLPPLLKGDEFVERGMLEADSYPQLSVSDKALRVSIPLGSIPAGTPVQAFESPLRIAAGPALAGRRVGVHYELSGANLRLPITGKLRLMIEKND